MVCDFKTYNDYKLFFNCHGDQTRTGKGIAPGNGLIHLKSFKKINGYDEYYKGYGLEDADFNLRISYINKLLTIDNEKINTCHLFHETIFRDKLGLIDIYNVNKSYYQNKRKKLLEQIGNEEINIYDEKKHLHLIMSNI